MAKAKKAKSSGSAKPKPPAASYVRDVNVLGKDATNRQERRVVLVSALANDWAAEDARTIERIDQAGWHGWAMWRQA